MPVLAFRKRVHTRLQIDQRARPGDSGDGRIRTAALTWGVVGCGFSLLTTVADSPCAMLIGGTTFREVGILSLSLQAHVGACLNSFWFSLDLCCSGWHAAAK
jgi:hypothetical protein